MRNPRFRAYHKIYKEMYDVASLWFNYDGTIDTVVIIIGNTFSDYELVKAKHVTIEQDTGLKDKNGKAVWEGDIVKIDMWDGNKRVPEVGYIVYDQLSAGFTWLSVHDAGSYHLRDMDYSIREVIGNIHDNPGLLEIKNDKR